MAAGLQLWGDTGEEVVICSAGAGAPRVMVLRGDDAPLLPGTAGTAAGLRQEVAHGARGVWVGGDYQVEVGTVRTGELVG